MVDKVLGQDFTDITSPTGTETTSVLQGGIVKDVSLTNIISGVSHNATSKTTPVDADELPLIDSAASNILKKLTWANVKATLKAYFDTLYLVSGDGWNTETHTWTYSSVDSPTGVVSINADVTASIRRGNRVKFNQDQALTAYWTFNTNSNSDVGAFNGTDTSMTYTAGKFSNAATFNGTTSKITLSDSASLKPTGEFTVGCWFKTSNTGAAKGLFQSKSANTAQAGFSIYVSSTNVVQAVIGKNTGTSAGVDYTTLTGTTTVTDGVFHYAVLTFRNNWAQLYVDGNLEASGYCYTPAYAATNYVRIGCINDSGTDGSLMNGQIDDLFFINGYALDEATIYNKYIAATAQGTGNITITKYGIVTKVGAYSGGATLVTIYHGTDFTLANATISSPYYSYVKCPSGFNIDPIKWRVFFLDAVTRSKSSAVGGTWYYSDFGSRNLIVPIGAWRIGFSCEMYVTVSALQVVVVNVALSTSNSTPTDNELRSRMLGTGHSATEPYVGLNTFAGKSINIPTKTTYYLIYKSDSNVASLVGDGASGNPAVIYAECAYL